MLVWGGGIITIYFEINGVITLAVLVETTSFTVEDYNGISLIPTGTSRLATNRFFLLLPSSETNIYIILVTQNPK